MNTNWSKILLFSLLFGVLGFVLGRMCGSCHGGGCEKEGMGMHDGATCHGEAGMAGKGGACCKMGEHHDSAMVATGGDTTKVMTPGAPH